MNPNDHAAEECPAEELVLRILSAANRFPLSVRAPSARRDPVRGLTRHRAASVRTGPCHRRVAELGDARAAHEVAPPAAVEFRVWLALG